MNQIPSALLEPAPAPHAKEPPGQTGSHHPPPNATPFAALLDDQARTAIAEGHERASVDPDASAGSDERGADAAAAVEPAKPGTPDAAALAALLGGVPLPADASVAVASPAAAASAEPQPAGGRVLSPGETFREQAREIVLTRTTRPIGVPADATALPPVSASAPATASSPSLSIGIDVAAAEGRGQGAGAGAAVPLLPTPVARATRLAEALQAAVRPADATASGPAATPGPATVAGAASAANADAPPANGAPAQAATAAPPSPLAAPANSPAPQAAAPAQQLAAPPRAVGLEHAVETVRLALRAGAERGVSHARISLTPRELGTVEIHLRHTSDGLVARVVAEHGAAVQQLQQAGADLRRQLEQSGIDVLRLDIGASGDETARRGAAFAGAFADRDRGDRRRAAGTGEDPLAPLDGDAETTATATLALPNGALVDVLA